jgi:F0F1-type ATP synthase delta subunit
MVEKIKYLIDNKKYTKLKRLLRIYYVYSSEKYKEFNDIAEDAKQLKKPRSTGLIDSLIRKKQNDTKIDFEIAKSLMNENK